MEDAILASVPGGGPSDPREALDTLRRHLAREPATAHALAVRLAPRAASLTRELQEYACIACLEMGDDDTSILYLDAIVGPTGDKSPLAGSRRARRLMAMAKESAGDPHGARGIYEQLLGENPGDVETHARLAALAGSFGRWEGGSTGKNKTAAADLYPYIPSYLKALRDHVESFPADKRALALLSRSLAASGRTLEALYAAESLLLMEPQCAIHHIAVGELCLDHVASSGLSSATSTESAPGARAKGPLSRAVSAFSEALLLNPGSVRAALGLARACSDGAGGPELVAIATRTLRENGAGHLVGILG